MDLQGQVQNLTLQAQSNSSMKTDYPDITLTSYIMQNLQPNTQYSVTLTITIYGGASITSAPALVKTKDGGKFWTLKNLGFKIIIEIFKTHYYSEVSW